MDDNKRLDVQSALCLYRDTVSQHNFNLLAIVVSMMEAEPLPAQVSAKTANQLHMRGLARYLQSSVPSDISTPRDFLNESLRVSLTESYELDGVSNRPVYANFRRENFDGVEKRIKEMGVDVGKFTPPNLEELCDLVSGVTGPARIGTHFISQQIAFASTIEEESLEDMIQAVYVPGRHFGEEDDDDDDDGGEDFDPWMDLWPNWEIAVAFKIGGGPHEWCGSNALYCRNEDNAQWEWRYGIHDNDCCSDVHDSVADFLLSNSHYKETTEEWVRKHFRTIKSVLRLP
ncbi:hypothetical protein VTL71DRAFT_16461 [Oculimacula yallundae]|uniref:Knr4/Smi1-like domain-containing protein n=1 Tax=Oculimacula yallundae TaxID=86028 RepID=A0ABR4CGQ9_9HELO